MNTRQADKLIKEKLTVTVHNTFYDETFQIRIVKRDRWNVYSADGGKYDRKELEIIPTHIIVKDMNKLRWAFPDQVLISNVFPYNEESVDSLQQENIRFQLAVKRPFGEFVTIPK